MWMKVRNTFIIFLVSGLWHGANWTFLAWGALNALYFMPLLLANNNRTNLDIVARGRNFPTIKEFFQILLTFFLTVLAWVFFRADSISHALQAFTKIFNPYDWANLDIKPQGHIFPLIVFFIIVEWVGREHHYAIAKLGFRAPRLVRYAFYYVIVMLIFLAGGHEQDFIYFQF
jgi:alginate O-acetyltransferase complex protein AlgI